MSQVLHLYIYLAQIITNKRCVITNDFICVGIYHHVIGEYMGAHVVRLIGWGTENGTDYWLAANSWGTNWGNNGTVKVKRNKNGCNFAKYVLGTAILRPASAVKF